MAVNNAEASFNLQFQLLRNAEPGFSKWALLEKQNGKIVTILPLITLRQW